MNKHRQEFIEAVDNLERAWNEFVFATFGPILIPVLDKLVVLLKWLHRRSDNALHKTD